MAEASESQNPELFSIIGEQKVDSLGTIGWRQYLNSERLVKAWTPQRESPYLRYQKTRTTTSISQFASDIRPRYSEGEMRSEKGIENLIQSGQLDSHTAVVLNSGGPHSVAMAIKLAIELGYQPVIMLDSMVDPKGSVRSGQDLATLLYYAQQIEQLKASGRISPDAPPAFVLDAHRDDSPMKGQVDNRNFYTSRDFPSAQELQRNGITKIVYLNEGNQNGQINQNYQSEDRLAQDLKPIARDWQSGGIQILYTGVMPW